MKVLIVDDEPLARRGLRRELRRMPEFSCVGESGSKDEAVAAIVALQPDLVLLDIQLGRATGFDVIEEIGLDAMPAIIFVTAYDRHALRAFEVHAVDYVVKPVDPDRLREALGQAVERQRPARQPAGIRRLVEERDPAASGSPERLVVRDGTRLAFVEVGAIDWIEACGNWVRLHARGRSHLLRSTLNRMEHRLAPGPGVAGQFIRVRRSALVNVRAVETVERYAKGMYTLRLRSGESIVSSRYHKSAMDGLVRG